MLFIALILAACLYVGLYLLWEASQSHLGAATNVLRLINNMLTTRMDIFFLLRWLIFLTFLYVVADFVYTAIRGKRKKKKKDEPPKISISKPKPDNLTKTSQR